MPTPISPQHTLTAAEFRGHLEQAGKRIRGNRDPLGKLLGKESQMGFNQSVLSGNKIPFEMASHAFSHGASPEQIEIAKANSEIVRYAMRPTEHGAVGARYEAYGGVPGRLKQTLPQTLRGDFLAEQTLYGATEKKLAEDFAALLRDNEYARARMAHLCKLYGVSQDTFLEPVHDKYKIDQSGGARIPPAILNRAADAGMFITAIPTKYDGDGYNHQQTAILLQALRDEGGAIMGHASSNKSIGERPTREGTRAQQDLLVPNMVHGYPNAVGERERALVSFILTGTESGTDAFSGSQRLAEISNDGEHIIVNGNSIFSTNFQVSGLAHIFVVFKDSGGTKIPAILEAPLPYRFNDTPADTKRKTKELWDRGFEASYRPQQISGITGSCQIYSGYNNAHFPAWLAPGVSSVLGGVESLGLGDQQASAGLYKGRDGIIMASAAGAEYALNLALDEVVQRVRFKQPIGKMQSVQKELTHMAINVEMLRAYSKLSSRMIDNFPDMNLMSETAIGKAFSTSIASEVARTARYFFGGEGAMKSQAIELLVNDLYIMEIVEGINPAMRQLGVFAAVAPLLKDSESMSGIAKILLNQIPSLEHGDLPFGEAFSKQRASRGFSFSVLQAGKKHGMGMRDEHITIDDIAGGLFKTFAQTACQLEIQELRKLRDVDKRNESLYDRKIAALEGYLTISDGKKLQNQTSIGKMYIDAADIRLQETRRANEDTLRRYA